MDTESTTGNRSTELVYWIAMNLLAMLLVGSLVSAMSLMGTGSIINNVIAALGSAITLGGGLIPAFSQWLIIRRYSAEGLGIFWVFAGAVSSIVSFPVIAISIMGLGNYPSTKDYLFFALLVISEHVIALSLVQGIIWWWKDSRKLTTAAPWVLIHLGGFTLIGYLAFQMTYTWVLLPGWMITTLGTLMALVFAASGYILARALERQPES